MEATYNITNDRLTLIPSRRLTQEEYNSAKALKFQWYPGRKIFSAIWGPEKVDFLLSLGIVSIEEDDTPDNVEARVDRFQRYADNAEAAAEQKYERAQEASTGRRRWLAGNAAVSEMQKAEHYQRRIAAAIAHAQYRDLPAVIARRIAKIEADKRRAERNIEEAEKFLRHYASIETATKENIQRIANYDSSGLWSKLHHNDITQEAALVEAQQHHKRNIAHYSRWLEHYNERLAYETAYLEAMGGTPPPTPAHSFKVGDRVTWRRHVCTVAKVNRTTITLNVESYGSYRPKAKPAELVRVP